MGGSCTALRQKFNSWGQEWWQWKCCWEDSEGQEVCHDRSSPQNQWLRLSGTVVLILSALDLVNLWLLRRDVRGAVSASAPARRPLIRAVAFFLSLNELVIFGLTVASFSAYRGWAFVVSIVSTLLGILWKLVQFLCVCSARDKKKKGESR
mmetsp:Transcript_46954/g.92682  ORF Transcript_46954/g.92682 Transcript_46954/m.92682 type:complete len:151 (+) Transcript_46954:440-892(+)